MITEEILKSIPSETGVYIFKKGNKYLYIGKAKNLKARILTHKNEAQVNSKEALIFNQADKIDYIISQSEFNALLLEAKLIQEKKPKYNVRWRDDKSHLYIKITVKDEYPKVLLSRKENDGRSLYFGPFFSTKVANQIIRFVRRIVPFCMQKKIGKRACFYSKINLCHPCPNYIESLTDYSLKRKLKKEYRKNIKKVIAILSGKGEKLINEYEKILKRLTKNQQYEQAITIRNQIINLKKLIEKGNFDLVNQEESISWPKIEKGIISLLTSKKIAIKKVSRIEGYDISNFSFKEAVGAMVVFIDGKPEKKEYRRFKIRDINLKDDFSMLAEVLKRRLDNTWTKPDLILIDGGRPQLRTLWKSLSEKIKIPIIGLAKNPDRLVFFKPPFETIFLESANPILRIFQAVRDEAHRFAKKYHTLLREKTLL
jgi:excinuclease ABC subunit C